MKKLAIVLVFSLLVMLLPGGINAQAAEVVPELGTITYTSQTNIPIELSDINTGSDGRIYITDKANAAAVVLNPLAAEYKVFSLAISGDTGDIQPAADGRIWYSDNKDQLGVFDPTSCPNQWDTCQGKVWLFPPLGPTEEKINIGPFTFDDQGRVWVGDFGGNATRLYRARQTAPDQLEYCPYDIDYYHTHDLKFHDGGIWFGDYFNHRILRFDPDSEILTAWQLDSSADPDGMTFDGSGNIWWVEINAQRIGHITFGTSNTITYYDIPGTAQPIAISTTSGKIWYSDKNGKVGQLNPETAIPSSSGPITELPLGNKSVTCETLNRVLIYGANYVETKPIQFNAFVPALNPPDTSTIGWSVYTIPGSIPAGMGAWGGVVYAADSNTSTLGIGKLMRFTLPQDQYHVYLPLILR